NLGLVGLAVIDVVLDGDLVGGGAVVGGCGRIPTGRRVAGRPARTGGHADVLRAGNAGRSGIADCDGERAGAAVAGGIGGLGCDRGGADRKDVAAVNLGLVGLAEIDIVLDGDLVGGGAVVKIGRASCRE